AEKAKAYGVPGVTVDGNDVLAVYEATRFAVERARDGHGVHVIEVKTYRRKGHAEHDDQHYVPKDELEWWAKENDPVDGYEERVIDTPMSEAAFVGAAAGEAHMGMRPVAEMQFIDFISCAYDMLTNYVATARYRAGLASAMVVRGPCGGCVRGGPFHSQNPEAGFLEPPGLKVVYPATVGDAKGVVK